MSAGFADGMVGEDLSALLPLYLAAFVRTRILVVVPVGDRLVSQCLPNLDQIEMRRPQSDPQAFQPMLTYDGGHLSGQTQATKACRNVMRVV